MTSVYSVTVRYSNSTVIGRRCRHILRRLRIAVKGNRAVYRSSRYRAGFSGRIAIKGYRTRVSSSGYVIRCICVTGKANGTRIGCFRRNIVARIGFTIERNRAVYSISGYVVIRRRYCLREGNSTRLRSSRNIGLTGYRTVEVDSTFSRIRRIRSGRYSTRRGFRITRYGNGPYIGSHRYVGALNVTVKENITYIRSRCYSLRCRYVAINGNRTISRISAGINGTQGYIACIGRYVTMNIHLTCCRRYGYVVTGYCTTVSFASRTNTYVAVSGCYFSIAIGGRYRTINTNVAIRRMDSRITIGCAQDTGYVHIA